MKHFLLALGVLALGFPQTATAQLKYLNLNVSMNGGYSILAHKTDFQTTPIYNLYNSTTVFAPDLTWNNTKKLPNWEKRWGNPDLASRDS